MENFITFFSRDMERLIEEVEQTSDDILWKTENGTVNSCGIFAQHIAGNLKHFIGSVVGNTGYERDREREFTNTGQSKEKLIGELQETKAMIQDVLSGIDEETLEEDYPLDIPWDYSIRELLLHLYGHLNYHRGQYNYLRRILEENKS